MLTEMRDTVGLGAARRWASSPRTPPRTRRWQAIDKIEKASNDGQIRRFTGNDYTRDISEGRLASRSSAGRATRRSSTADNKNVALQAARGGVHGLHGLHADPGRRAARVHGAEDAWTSSTTRRSQAQITAYVNYVPPVKGTKEVLARDRPGDRRERARSSRTSRRRTPSRRSRPRTSAEIDEAFQRAIGA